MGIKSYRNLENFVSENNYRSGYISQQTFDNFERTSSPGSGTGGSISTVGSYT